MILSKSKIIKAPIHEVWPVVSDLTLVAKLTPACMKTEPVTDQRQGIGTQTRWYSIVTSEPSLEEIVEWRPMEYYAWHSYSNDVLMIEGSLSVAPTPHGYTIVTLTEDFLLEAIDIVKAEPEMERELVTIAKYFEERKNKK